MNDLIEAAEEVLRISDRNHVAWDRLRAAIAEVREAPVVKAPGGGRSLRISARQLWKLGLAGQNVRLVRDTSEALATRPEPVRGVDGEAVATLIADLRGLSRIGTGAGAMVWWDGVTACIQNYEAAALAAREAK